MTTSLNIRPTKDRVLVKVDKTPEEKTSGGIILMASDKDKRKAQRTGTVVAVGPKAQDIKVGMIIHFEYFSGSDMGEDHIIIAETQILGYMEN